MSPSSAHASVLAEVYSLLRAAAQRAATKSVAPEQGDRDSEEAKVKQ